jgi:hypothetical protein
METPRGGKLKPKLQHSSRLAIDADRLLEDMNSQSQLYMKMLTPREEREKNLRNPRPT